MDLTLVTCLTPPGPDPDAERLDAALSAAGISSQALAWDDPAADFSSAPTTLVRSPWNYPQHYPAFVDWVNRASAQTRLVNPPEVLLWNAHKKYLVELAESGLAVTPTEYAPQDTALDVAELCSRRQWTGVVVKPAVSCGSFRTRRFESGAQAQPFFDELNAERDVLVQAFLPSIDGYGERALVTFDGQITHAVRKEPCFDGGTPSQCSGPKEVADDERALVSETFAALQSLGYGELLYARVDVARNEVGTPVLMELELIEPCLFLDRSEAGLARYVEGIRRRLEN